MIRITRETDYAIVLLATMSKKESLPNPSSDVPRLRAMSSTTFPRPAPTRCRAAGRSSHETGRSLAGSPG